MSKTKKVEVRLADAAIAELKAVAKLAGVSLNTVIRVALAFAAQCPKAKDTP